MTTIKKNKEKKKYSAPDNSVVIAHGAHRYDIFIRVVYVYIYK